MEEQLWKACSDGNAEDVKHLLQNEQITLIGKRIQLILLVQHLFILLVKMDVLKS